MVKIIDGNNLLLGRLGTWVAKQLLEGEQIYIINAENIAISGNPVHIVSETLKRRTRGEPFHGPFFPTRPDFIVRRAIKGMLPYTKERGVKAYRRMKVFMGTPEIKSAPAPITLPQASLSKLKVIKYIYLKDLSASIKSKKE